MKTTVHQQIAALACLLLAAIPQISRGQQADSVLPPGVKTVWNLDRAWKETTSTRQRISINGLWKWQPAEADAGAEPAEGWGYFKAPGCWPGISDYLQKDSQAVYPNPIWKGRRLGEISAAWYQREIQIPADWAGRRIALSADDLNSFASVFIDGKKIGEMRFPGGEIDLSAVCRPGATQTLSLLVVAMPLKGVMLSYTDSANARLVKGAVARRGLCGDLYLVGTPVIRLEEVKAETSYRRGELAINAAMQGLVADGQYQLHAQVSKDGRQVTEFSSRTFSTTDLTDGHLSFTAKWKPDQLWDLNTPQNTFDLQVSLLDAAGKVLDTGWNTKLGFRELWIDGRDFYLNGTRLFLSAVPIDNAQIGASLANYQAVRTTLQRLKKIGINLVYTHNYDCTPGAHLSFEELLRAADDEGMLVSFTQPHFSSYDWQATDADTANGYARDAAYYARIAGNHPSVVFYSTSHNATGYEQDMNPDLIDGVHDPRETWGQRNSKLALRAEAIIHRFDPTRIVYHHAGGNIGSMHTINFYPNFAPIQELSDWFGHWAKEGVKPVFMCEYRAPFSWDWTMYRGWYQGKREWGSAVVPWEFCLAEWDAQFFGDRAFAIGDLEKANLRWEDKQYQAGRVWHRWDYPTQVGSPRLEDRNQVMGMYITDNWRAYRSWGVSGISPWEYEMFWTPRNGVDRKRKQLPVDWDNLQRPGLSPDYVDSQFESIDTAFEYEDWIPTAAGQAVLRNNMPVLAYIAGGGEAFTSKDHNYLPGQTLEKQLVIINNSRQTLTFVCDWELGLPRPIKGQKQVNVETGQQARIPLHLDLPAALAAGAYELRAAVRFADRQEQTDRFTIDVLPPPRIPALRSTIALFDPKGQTEAALEELGIDFRRVKADSRLEPDEILVIGKLALTLDGPAPDISAVRAGMKVILFEQSPEALRDRLGFRVNEYGLRQIFPRIPDHPALAGIGPENLHDWRGEATTLPPRLTFENRPRYGPIVSWNGIEVPHIWRCGNRGDVASALIEKPARGDFRPILDGGYSLQYSPLMEYREGKGLVIFCQLDATGRTESDPAATTLMCNILRYVDGWRPTPRLRAAYLGDAAGNAHLASSGVKVEAYDGGDLQPAEQVLVLAPGQFDALAADAPAIARFVGGGGHVLAIGLDQKDVSTLPGNVTLKNSEHIAASFAAPSVQSAFAGIGPADVFNRGPRQIPLIADGATPLGDGALGSDSSGRIAFDQLIPWQFDYRKEYNLKRTYRRSSFVLTRVLGNLGVAMDTPLLGRFRNPPKSAPDDKRWLDGLYLDAPQEWDDPYRFFRW